jgi:hypothetical protein
LINKIRHGNSIPASENLENYQFGYSDSNDHLYVKNGKDNIVDVMGWKDSQGGGPTDCDFPTSQRIRLDTGKTFFRERIYRICFNGTVVLNNIICYPQKIEVTENGVDQYGNSTGNKGAINITGIIGYGGYTRLQYVSGKKAKVLLPTQYVEYCHEELDTITINPAGFIENGCANYRLYLVGQKHNGSETNNKQSVTYFVYVDFTDGT